MRRALHRTLVLSLLGAWPAARSAAQPTPVRRDEAVQTALGRAARLGVARADTAVAYAQLLTARAWQNPTLSTAYSRATPRYHVAADLPFDLSGLRGARVRSAQAGRQAARFRFASERAAVALGADTAYTRALAARERLRLSRRDASAADSLRVIAGKRRDAGDASDLDVELAAVNAGQRANVAATDSLTYVSAVLDLQAVMGLPADGVAITPADSLIPPTFEEATEEAPDVAPLPAGFLLAAPRAAGTGASPVADEAAGTVGGSAAPVGTPPSVAAAQASLRASQLAVQVERRSVWGAPSLSAGFETGDPSGSEPGILPTVGVSIPLPLLSRNRGPIAQAEAERARAQAELRLAEVESRTEIARARRRLVVALDRVGRDRALLAAANRVAAKSITAYREGASALPNVLEAQRNAREVLAQYVDAMADAWVASATLRVLTATVSSPSPFDAPR